MKMKTKKRLWQFLKKYARGYNEKWVDFTEGYSETHYLNYMIERVSDSFMDGGISIELSGYNSRDDIAHYFDFDENDFSEK